MRIIVVGAGNVGYFLCETLSQARHNVTLIENEESIASEVDDNVNVRVVEGNGVSASVLVNAGVSECEYFLAMTSDDRTNVLSSSLAKALGAKTTITRVHDQTYTDHSIVNYQFHFGIDYLLNPEALSAVELAKSIRNPDRVAVENFARGEIEVQMLRISSDSSMIGHKLKDLKVDERILIAYVERENHIEVAGANTILQENDKVTLVGPSDVLLNKRAELEGRKKPTKKNVTLFGGSETAIAMIRLLSNPRFNLRLIESDRELCETLSERFKDITVIHGSATSLRLMEEEHIGQSDYFVACTKKDEDNIMTCLQAAKLGCKHVQLVINKPDYENILEEMRYTLGVESAVAPRVVTVNEVMRLTSQKAYNSLASLSDGKVEVIEVDVQHGATVCDKKLNEIDWPQTCLIAAILHKYEARVPSADDKILAGDRLVAILEATQINELLKCVR